LSAFLTFLEENALMGSRVKAYKIGHSEFWLETSDGFISARLVMNADMREILYDVFSPMYDTHLKEETLDDVERLDSIVELAGNWQYEKSIEDLWLALDWIKLWARRNDFDIRETHLI
jgi:hypothetical protein